MMLFCCCSIRYSWSGRVQCNAGTVHEIRRRLLVGVFRYRS